MVSSSRALITLALTAGTTGCMTTSKILSVEFAGSDAVFASAEFEQLNLCNTLAQFDLAGYKNVDAPTEPLREEKSIFQRITLQEGSLSYPGLCLISTKNDDPAKLSRNSFVGYVMGISDEVCGRYKADLLNRKAFASSSLGFLTTLFAGVSSVATHENIASAYAAAAGISSGTNAVISQERFGSLAIEIITAGIEQKRGELERNIEAKFSRDLISYPVGSAIQDAMEYHSTCSAITGLEAAKDSIVRADDPGVRRFRQLQRELDAPLEDPTSKAPGQFETAEDTPLSGIDVLTTADKLIGAVVSAPNVENDNGSVTVSGNTLNFIPKQDYSGITNINYTITGLTGTQPTNRAVSVLVVPVNDAPIATDDPEVTLKKGEMKSITGLLTNDSDIDDGDILKIAKVEKLDSKSGGSAVVDAGNLSVTFSAPATAEDLVLIYTIEDGKGGSASARIPIKVTD